MPRTYTSNAEARSSLIQQSKKWREDFKTLKDKFKKAEEQNLIKTIDVALDEVVSTSAHILEKQDGIEKELQKIGEGADVANQLAVENGAAMDTIKQNLMEDATYIKDLQKKTQEAERQAKSSLNLAHSMQLERASTGIICRNIRPLPRGTSERYEDMEKAFNQAMTLTGYVPKVAFIRRLMRVKSDDRTGPTPLLVTLTSPGERAKLYTAIDRATKAGTKLGFSVTSEVPKYAIPQYKYMGRLANIIRDQFPELRTRVHIVRGDTWPTVSVKHVNDNKFVKADANMLEHAKAEYAKQNREKAAARSQNRASKQTGTAASASGMEPMDVGAAGARPQRAAKKQPKV